jgi:hypothetical protein
MKYQAEVMEFPAFAELPLGGKTKREKTQLAKVWDAFQDIRKVVEEKGMLVPQTFASKVMGVSHQRIGELLNNGKLESVEFNGTRFVTEESLIAFCKTERKTGRPPKLPTTYGEAAKRSIEYAKETVKNAKEAGKSK